MKDLRILPRRFLVLLVSVYQAVLSPARGMLRWISPNQCLYTPSCSEYGKMAVKKHGAVKGAGKAVWRILRCGPFGRVGVDLP